MHSVGTDRVIVKGASRIVYAAAAMDGWEVRAFRRAAILYQGDRYLVSRVEPWGREGMRYVLDPWPAEGGDEPLCEIVYDGGLVAARDEALRCARRQQRRLPIVWLARPFTGFLWSAVKRRLHDKYGLHPRGVTEGSLWIQFAALVLCGGLASIGVMGTIYGGAPVVPVKPLLAAGLVIGLDALARYNAMLHETLDLPGFCEWLFRRPRSGPRR